MVEILEEKEVKGKIFIRNELYVRIQLLLWAKAQSWRKRRRKVKENRRRRFGVEVTRSPSVVAAYSFAPPELDRSAFRPTAYAVGCILAPLRGWF
jgi:hypothetical protein